MSNLTIKQENDPQPIHIEGEGWHPLHRIGEFFKRHPLFAHKEQPQAGRSDFLPAVEVKETEKSYLFTVDVPGIPEKDVEVLLDGDCLMIKGQRSEEREEKEENRYFSERLFGSFSRTFRLPAQADKEHISANLKRGVLFVEVPKR